MHEIWEAYDAEKKKASRKNSNYIWVVTLFAWSIKVIPKDRAWKVLVKSTLNANNGANWVLSTRWNQYNDWWYYYTLAKYFFDIWQNYLLVNNAVYCLDTKSFDKMSYSEYHTISENVWNILIASIASVIPELLLLDNNEIIRCEIYSNKSPETDFYIGLPNQDSLKKIDTSNPAMPFWLTEIS